MVLRPGESDQGWRARHVRCESARAYPDVLRRRASSDLTTNSITCLSLIGEGFSREREWLPAGSLQKDPSVCVPTARGCVELMSGSVSRVSRGVTRVAVEVPRERERSFWGKLQTAQGIYPGAARPGSRDPFAGRLATGPAPRLAQGDDERDEAAYSVAVTSPKTSAAGHRASGVGVERLRCVVTRGTSERECCL